MLRYVIRFLPLPVSIDFAYDSSIWIQTDGHMLLWVSRRSISDFPAIGKMPFMGISVQEELLLLYRNWNDVLVLRICLHKATEKSAFCISSLGRYGEGSPDLAVVSTILQPKELSTWFVFNASKEAYFQIEFQKVQNVCGLFGRSSLQDLSGCILPTFNLGMTWRGVWFSHLPKSSRLYWRVHCAKRNWDAWTGTWTLDPQIKSLMLYRLSYPGPGREVSAILVKAKMAKRHVRWLKTNCFCPVSNRGPFAC